MTYKNLLLFVTMICCNSAYTQHHVFDTAVLSILDLDAFNTTILEIPVGKEYGFKKFIISIYHCEMQDEDYIVNISAVHNSSQKTYGPVWLSQIYPSISNLDLPGYDIKLIRCCNTAKPE